MMAENANTNRLTDESGQVVRVGLICLREVVIVDCPLIEMVLNLIYLFN